MNYDPKTIPVAGLRTFGMAVWQKTTVTIQSTTGFAIGCGRHMRMRISMSPQENVHVACVDEFKSEPM